MFLLSDIGNVRSGLEKKTEGLKEKIHVLNGNKEYLDRQVKEQENNLRELIIAKKINGSGRTKCTSHREEVKKVFKIGFKKID